jgi:arsenate reductase-like glutaredoxin family protein
LKYTVFVKLRKVLKVKGVKKMWIKLKNGDETYARSIQFEDLLKEKIEDYEIKKIVDKLEFNQEELLENYIEKEYALDYVMENYDSDEDRKSEVYEMLDKIISLTKSKEIKNIAEMVKCNISDWFVQ